MSAVNERFSSSSRSFSFSRARWQSTACISERVASWHRSLASCARQPQPATAHVSATALGSRPKSPRSATGGEHQGTGPKLGSPVACVPRPPAAPRSGKGRSACAPSALPSPPPCPVPAASSLAPSPPPLALAAAGVFGAAAPWIPGGYLRRPTPLGILPPPPPQWTDYTGAGVASQRSSACTIRALRAAGCYCCCRAATPALSRCPVSLGRPPSCGVGFRSTESSRVE